MRSDVYPRHGMMAGANHDELAAQKFFLGTARVCERAPDVAMHGRLHRRGAAGNGRARSRGRERPHGRAQKGRRATHFPELGRAAAHFPGVDVGLRGRHGGPPTRRAGRELPFHREPRRQPGAEPRSAQPGVSDPGGSAHPAGRLPARRRRGRRARRGDLRPRRRPLRPGPRRWAERRARAYDFGFHHGRLPGK